MLLTAPQTGFTPIKKNVGNKPTTQKKCRFGLRLNLMKKLTHQDLATTKGGELTVTYYSARKYSEDVMVTEFRYKRTVLSTKLCTN